MPQCERILENGDRCAAPAQPGSRFCPAHAEAAPAWRAVPSPAGRKPAFPGLRSDERNVLVAQRGLVWLEPGPGEELFSRLVRVLSVLSQDLDLAAHARILRPRRGEDYLVLVTPPDARAPNLSAFYDAVASAARLANGRLYVGKRAAFVPYRDCRAPRGYDVADFPAPAGADPIRLVDRRGSHAFARADLARVRLDRLCLRIAPVPDRAGPPQELHVLAPRAYYGLLGRYLHAHRLHYGLAALHTPRGEALLFRVGPRPDAPAGQALPRFVLDYLSRLPRVALLVSGLPAGGPLFLVAWRHRYPLALRSVAGAFAPDDLVLLPAPPDPCLRVRPAPAFVGGDVLTAVHAPRPAAGLRAQPAGVPPALRLPVLLRPDSGPTPPTAALVLTPQELPWLRQLLYRLPGDALTAYSLYRGEGFALLLASEGEVTGIPFGLPLRRLGGTNLFLPLRSRFVPDLPADLLRQALALREDTYTVLTPDYRLDVPAADCAPLSRALLAEPPRPRVDLQVRPAADLAGPAWTVPRPPPAEVGAPGSRDESAGTTAEAPVAPAPAPGGERDLAAVLRERARAYEEAEDFLSAALCYSLLDDEGNRARCYRRAALAGTARGS